jgi:hypothetical protein
VIRALNRKVLSCLMVAIFPAALFSADQPGAMLHTQGTTLLNGSSIVRSSAIFSGDLVQTNKDSIANINATGSTVLVLNGSLVQYEGSSIKLEHGGVTVSTLKLLATQVGGVTVSPVSSVWTEFEVRNIDGRVRIVARKGDLDISDSSGATTLAQGQETTRDQSGSQKGNQGKKRAGGATAPAATPGILDSPVAIGIATGVVGGVTAWALIKSDNPASPVK